MAITLIEPVSPGAVVAAHSLVAVFADTTHDGTAPSYIYVDVLDADDNLLITQRCPGYGELLPTERRYRWEVGATLRSFMPAFDDFDQNEDTIEPVPNGWKAFKLRFYSGEVEAETSFAALHAAAQYGNSSNLNATVNGYTTYYTRPGKYAYYYLWNAYAGVTISATNTDLIYANAPVGLYRMKYATYGEEFSFMRNFVFVIRSINAVAQGDDCSAYIKYLDRRGEYRYFAFNSFYRISEDSKQIGTVNYLGAGTEFDYAPTRSVGMASERAWALTAEGLDEGQLAQLGELCASPRQYLYLNDATPVLVKIDRSGVLRTERGGFTTETITAKLPTVQNITMR